MDNYVSFREGDVLILTNPSGVFTDYAVGSKFKVINKCADSIAWKHVCSNGRDFTSVLQDETGKEVRAEGYMKNYFDSFEVENKVHFSYEGKTLKFGLTLLILFAICVGILEIVRVDTTSWVSTVLQFSFCCAIVARASKSLYQCKWLYSPRYHSPLHYSEVAEKVSNISNSFWTYLLLCVVALLD